MPVALLAVALGATVLSGLITLSQDIPRQMGREFRSYGANMVLVPSGAAGASIPLAAVGKAAALIPPESRTGVAPYRYHPIKINEQPFMAAGTTLSEARKTSPYWLVHGRWPARSGEALVGKEVADTIRLSLESRFSVTGADVFGNPIAGIPFTVAGIVETGGPEEAFVVMSLEDFEAMTGAAGIADSVECSIALSVRDLEALAEAIHAAVPEARARLVKRVAGSEGAVLAKLSALIALVTGIILLLTVICVATTMMAVVSERRREIGLRKALGADSAGLVGEFLGEAVCIGAAGGLLGALAGYGFARYVGFAVFSQPVSMSPLTPPLTAVFSMVLTALACMIPVRRAAEIDPATVLRGE
jgi:putative ABC transport system permease protein